jgi:hypothetical protein
MDSWIRIRIPNMDPDPLTQLNPDPLTRLIRFQFGSGSATLLFRPKALASLHSHSSSDSTGIASEGISQATEVCLLTKPCV